jgi:glycine/D-amino acid oxidase-like deaminating enzyme
MLFPMPGYGSRYWSDRTADNRRRSYPKYKGKETVDAVVIGGGLTGATAAYVLASAGHTVILLEAAQLAEGSTAGSLGAIVPEPDASYRAVEAAAGRRVARTAWNEAKKSARDFAVALKKLPTRCDLESSALVINARTSADVSELRKEQAARRGASVVASWLSPASARAEVGGESAGALRLGDAFVFDPVRATLGLAGAAEAAGARIFEQSAVRRTRFTRKYADVLLASGAIRTRLIFVATGEPGALFGQLRRHVHRETGYAVVTEPLSAAMRREAGRRAAILTELGPSRPFARWLAEDRVLYVGARSTPPPARQSDKFLRQRTAQLMYELSTRYPSISGLPAHWGWDLPVVSTPDGLPWIGVHRNYPFHFFAMAFGWHGDGMAWFAARAALRSLRQETRRDDEVFGFARYL